MAKVLTDVEMLDIIFGAIKTPEIDDADVYGAFLGDLAKLICDYFGGDPGFVGYDPNDGLGWTVNFRVNENVPADGGVFAKYDPDVIWKDGEEIQL